MHINSKWLGLLFTFFVMPVHAQLNIFACEPEYAELAKVLTNNKAKIFSATTAFQDPHFVQARPSLIAKMRKADLVVCAGAALETAWLPMLQQKSRNSRVISTDKGLFYASDHVQNIDIPVSVDRSMGDVHALGNPHVHLDPIRLASIAKALNEKLQVIDPDNATEYQKTWQNFDENWTKAIMNWQELAKPLSGTTVIAYHSTFKYLLNFLGMKQVGDLEPKPGLPPTTSHLRALIKQVEQSKVPLVIYSFYQNDKGINWLQEKTGITPVRLPYTIGGSEKAQDLYTLFDQHIALLLNALGTTKAS